MIIEEGLDKLAEEIEMPLIRVLADMERKGVLIDENELGSIATGLREDIINLENEIYDLSGSVFNISSTRQLGIYFF